MAAGAARRRSMKVSGAAVVIATLAVSLLQMEVLS
jgi:hypothetical protein